MKRFSALALLALTLAHVASGCSSSDEAGNTPTTLDKPKIKAKKSSPTTYKLKPSVVQIGQVVANRVHVLADQLEMPLDAPGIEVLASAQPGQILVGPPNQRPASQKAAAPGELNPLGFARKVVRVTKTPDRISIDTANAILTDVFEELSVTVGDPNLIARLGVGDAFDPDPGPSINALRPGLQLQDDSGKSCAQVAHERGWPVDAYTCDDGTHGWCNGHDPTTTSDCAQCCSPSCGDIGAKLGKTASDPPLQCDNGNGSCNGTGVVTWDCSHGCCGPGLTSGSATTSNGTSDLPVTMQGPQGLVDFALANTIGEIPASGSLTISPSFTFSPSVFFQVYIAGGVMHNLAFYVDGQASAGLKVNGSIEADPKGIAEFYKKLNPGAPEKEAPEKEEKKAQLQILTLVLPLGLPVPVVLDVKVAPTASWKVGVSGSLDMEGVKTWHFRKGLYYDSQTPGSSECGNWPGATCLQPDACAQWQQQHGSAPACSACTLFNGADPCQPGPWFTLDGFDETPWSWTKQSVEVTGKVSATVALQWDIGLMLGGIVGPFVQLDAPKVTGTLSLDVGAVSVAGDQPQASACYWHGAADVDVGYSVAVGCRAQIPYLGNADTPTYPLGGGSVNVFHSPLPLPSGVCLSCYPAISQHACSTSTDCCSGNCVGAVNGRTCACSSEGGACVIDSDCCPQTGKPVACDNGVCTSSCATQCTADATECVSPAMFRRCEAAAGGCMTWKTYDCKTSTACYASKDECVSGPSCQDACTLGATECVAPSIYRKCESGPQGCTVWNSSYSCKTSTACFSNKDECINGAKPCSCLNGKKADGTPIDPASTFCGYKVCGMDGSEYVCGSDNQWAPTGVTCGPTCQDACTLGATECVAPSIYRKCESGPQGCTVWNSSYSCKTSTACFSNKDECVNGASCQNACTLGATECVAPNLYRKCEKGADSCTGWKTYDCKTSTACYSSKDECTTGVVCKKSYETCSTTSQCCSGLTCKKDADNTLACLP